MTVFVKNKGGVGIAGVFAGSMTEIHLPLGSLYRGVTQSEAKNAGKVVYGNELCTYQESLNLHQQFVSVQVSVGSHAR